MMVYHRTDQAKGRSAVYLPEREWIICAGQHQGLIPGKTWVAVQQQLDNNKCKAYRKPRSNEALLTGLLTCSCGGRMYPKLSQRKTADGQMAFAYVCKWKQRSQQTLCTQRNLNGNLLDAAIWEQIKQLPCDKTVLISLLEKNRHQLSDAPSESDRQRHALQQERADALRKLNGLVDSLADLPDSAARAHTSQRINQLDQAIHQIDKQLQQLNAQSVQRSLSPSGMDTLCTRWSSWPDSLASWTVRQKRLAVQSLFERIQWDGKEVLVSLS